MKVRPWVSLHLTSTMAFFEQSGDLWHLLRGQVVQALNLAIVCQGQQGIQEAFEQVLVLAKDAFEGQVDFGVEVAAGHGVSFGA